MPVTRVILITPGFTADEQDHNCLPTLQLFVLELLRQGLSVDVVALDYPFYNTPYTWHGARIYPCDGHNSRWLKPQTIWRALNIGQRLLRETPGTAVLHSFWLGWASGIGERLAKRFGVRHITTLMGQDVLLQNRHRFRFVTTGRLTRLVVLSNFQNDVLEKNASFRVAHVIPWGVSDAEIPPLLPENRPIDVLGVGSLIALKNWDVWLETIALAAKEHPNLRAMLIGSGPERGNLERLAQQSGLKSIVSFAGDMARPLVLEKMRQAKVLLHTSSFESQGYVLSEAAMNGCRIVGTPVGIATELGNCASTATDLAVLVSSHISDSLQPKAYTPFLMSETVQTYLELYNVAL